MSLLRKSPAGINKQQNIHISLSDKGGRIVIMDERIYQQKLRDLIDDKSIYAKVNDNRSMKETEKFISDVKKLLKKGRHLLAKTY